MELGWTSEDMANMMAGQAKCNERRAKSDEEHISCGTWFGAWVANLGVVCGLGLR